MTIIDKIKQQDGLIKSLQSRLSTLATESEQLRKERDELQAKLDKANDCLTSISKNTCCDKCQEAALVAKEALECTK